MTAPNEQAPEMTEEGARKTLSDAALEGAHPGHSAYPNFVERAYGYLARVEQEKARIALLEAALVKADRAMELVYGDALDSENGWANRFHLQKIALQEYRAARERTKGV